MTDTAGPTGFAGLRVLAVDDERPALDELRYLLERQSEVAEVCIAADATAALRELGEHQIDALFLDINMPGLSGLELAGVLRNYAAPPAIVFVTAHDDRAVDAFDVGAVDYLLKPLREERLRQALARLIDAHGTTGSMVRAAAPTAVPGDPPAADTAAQSDDETIPVELGGVTSLVRRDSISWVEAVGDYARLHSTSGAHLVRVPLSSLESRWRDHGFVRVHRSYLVAIAMVSGLRTNSGHTVVVLRGNGSETGVELPVSRRQARDLKDRLVRDPMRQYRGNE